MDNQNWIVNVGIILWVGWALGLLQAAWDTLASYQPPISGPSPAALTPPEVHPIANTPDQPPTIPMPANMIATPTEGGFVRENQSNVKRD